MNTLTRKHQSQTITPRRRPVRPRLLAAAPQTVRARRYDALERQAADAARRVQRREHDVARHLSAAPVGAYHLADNRSEPLPANLREELEAAFGADLAAVRIHRTVAAAAAVRAEQARAFAAGAHIYFGAGEFRPHTQTGQNLLAHEVAHVLQQTGRRDADGVLHATPRTGAGAIQRTAIDDLFAAKEVFQNAPTLKTVIALHVAAAPGDADLAAEGVYLAGLLGDFSSGHPKEADLLAAVTARKISRKAELVALYFDVLKGMGLADAATKLTGGKPPDQTAFGLVGFYYQALQGDLTWLDGVMRGPAMAGVIKDISNTTSWSGRYAGSFRVYLNGPARVVQNLGTQRAFAAAVDERLAQAKTPTALIDNERFYVALAALKAADDLRQAALVLAEEFYGAKLKALRGRLHPIDLKLEIAAGLVITGGDITVFAASLAALAGKEAALAKGYALARVNKLLGNLPLEAGELTKLAAPKVKEVAETTGTFWQSLIALEKQRTGQDKSGAPEVAAEIVAAIGTRKEFKKLDGQIAGLAQRLFRLPSGRLPRPQTYVQQLSAAKKSIAGLTYQYDQQLARLQQQVEQGKTIDENLALQSAWVVLLLTQVAFELDSYSLTKSGKSLVETYGTYRQEHADRTSEESNFDVRLAHRQRTARWLAGMAEAANLAATRLTMSDVLFGTLKGQARSYLALLGTWEESPAELDQFSEEVRSGGMVAGLEPLTGNELVNFVYAGYYARLTDLLRRLLREQGGDFSGAKGPIINQALELMKTEWVRPRRWLMREFEATIRPADRGDFKALVVAHPNFARLAREKFSKTDAYFIPDFRFQQNGVVVWMLPAMDQLVALLKQIPGIDALVTAALAGAGATAGDPAAAPPTPPAEVSWYTWLQALAALVQKDPKLLERLVTHLGPDGKIVPGDIGKAVRDDLDAKRVALAVEARRATSHERRVRLNKMRALWDAYDPQDIRTFTRPNQALQMMLEFAGQISPPADQRLQLAALVVELGPVMYDKLGPQEVAYGLLGSTSGTERLDLIVTLLPQLTGTLGLVKDAQAAALLQDSGWQPGNPKDFNLDVPKGFAVHVQAVEKLKTLTEGKAIAYQTKFTLGGSPKSNSLYNPGRGYPLLAGPENLIRIDGITYELVKVYKSFTFHPSLTMAAGGIQWEQEELGTSILEVDGKEVKPADRTGDKLFELKRDGKLVTVTDKDDRLLAELTHAVTMHAIIAQLQDLAAAMQALAELGLDVAELIPGFGQAIMVARLVAGVLTFIASDEFDQLKTVVGKDGDELIDLAIKKIKETFSADILWDWLLFGDNFPTIPLLTATPRQEQTIAKMPTQRGSKGKLRRLVEGLLKLAVTVGHGINVLHDHITYPMRRVQLFVVSTPLVALILRLIINNFERLRAIELAELGPDAVIGSAKERLEAMANLSQRIEEILASLSNLELPAEIVSLDTLVDIVLELVTNHLGGKYKVGVKLIRAGLQKIGAWSKIVGAIADELRSADMDPNILWRSAVRDTLQPHLHAAGTDLAAAITDLITQVPFLAAATGPAAAPVAVSFDDEASAGDDGPEVQEYPSADRMPAAAAPALTAVGAGRTLNPHLGADAARRFGHDFSHVRLHEGAEAGHVTRAFGADALTSGSHIYMRPGLYPGAGRGAHIFRHELTHVLQQTGPRPLGLPASPRAVAGRTGAGLRLDDRQEAAAERVAAATGAGHAHAPVNPGPLAPLAAQPSLTAIAKKFFRKTGDAALLRKRVEDIDAAASGVLGKGKLDANAQDVANQLPGLLISTIGDLAKTGVKKRFDGPFDTVADKIVAYIIDNHKPDILKAVPRLVKRSMAEVKKAGAKKGQKAAKEWRLDRGRLEVEVEEYLFGKTGVVFDIEFNTTTAAAAGGTGGAKVIDLSDPFKTIKVEGIHLAFIGGTANLWDLIIENTFEKNTPLLFRTKYRKGNKDDWAKYKNRARLLLAGQGPQPGIFMKTQFRFSHLTAKNIEALVYPVGGAVPGEFLPKIKHYTEYTTKLDYASGVADYNWHQTYGFLGIRFGRYSERKKLGDPQFGKNRDAHHLTQYLLLEYLSNKKRAPYKPFRHGLSNYPGVKGAAGLVNTITNAAGTAIKVGEYEKGRGGKMPTILISRFAHTYGDLHLNGTADDALDERSSQGGTVHAMFTGALGPEYEAILFAAKPTKLQTVEKQTKGLKVAPADQVKVGTKLATTDMLQEKVFEAACKTYTQVRNDMMGRLKPGLESREIEYYADLAVEGKKKGTDFVLSASALSAALKEAHRHNDAIMEGEIGFVKRK